MKRTLTLFSMFVMSVACSNSSDDDVFSLGPRARTTAQLVQFDSCGEVENRLRENLREEMRVRLVRILESDQFGHPELRIDESAAAEPASAEATGNGGQEGVDFSGTNNQEAGVDEADFVKTDGEHIYLINGNRVEIFGVPTFGELVPESTTEVEGHPSQMLIGEDRLVVFSAIMPWSLPQQHPLQEFIGGGTSDGLWYYYANILTKATILDVTDRTAPALVRELYIEGWHQTARRVDSSVRTVSYASRDVHGLEYWPEYSWDRDRDEQARREALERAVLATIAENDATINALTLDDLVPMVLERRPSGEIFRHSFTGEGCQNFAIADDGTSRGFTSILSFDLLNVDQRFESDHIVSNWSQIYASSDTLVVAEYAQDWWWFWNNNDFEEATNIHRFDISVAGQTAYTGSGRVPGTVRDQFSLSEYEGNIRVASTVGRWNRWWLPVEEQTGPLNYVYVLNGETELSLVGQTPGLAEGEQIWSSRFVGDKAYLVTFRQVDPLFTIDLSDPTDPKVLGELKIAGVSTYIHPLEDGEHLLTIGIAGDDNGLFWGQTQLSLFDVGDFSDPKLDDAMTLIPESGDGWYYAFSEAQWEHKAFQYWGPKNLLAIPLSTYRQYQVSGGEWAWEYSTRLELINVDLETETLAAYGDVDHSAFFNSDNEYWWSSPAVRRSIFMGDYIYAISDKGVTAHHTESMEMAATQTLIGPTDSPYWFW
ncbi:MAG: beta-propeller domain-containing protein [Myxococcota bacterium]